MGEFQKPQSDVGGDANAKPRFSFLLLPLWDQLRSCRHCWIRLFILANDPEAGEILVVVVGLEGSVLTRRHSWISPRFNAQIFLLPLCPGTVATGAPVWSARSVFGGRAPTHPKVGERLKYPALGTDPLPSSLALRVNPHEGPANACAN